VRVVVVAGGCAWKWARGGRCGRETGAFFGTPPPHRHPLGPCPLTVPVRPRCGAHTGAAAEASCLEFRAAGFTVSGVYNVTVAGVQYPVYCDQTTDGGGWTLVAASTIPLTDAAAAFHTDLTTINPTGTTRGVWSGFRVGARGGTSDFRVTCKVRVCGTSRTLLPAMRERVRARPAAA
jgi:hypothetical protein